jgi:hypothetical protein
MTEKQTFDCINKLEHWLEQDDIVLISDEYQADSLETEKETEKETKFICPPSGELDDKRLPNCQHDAVIALYHQHLPTLRRVEIWNDTRKAFLRQRWREVSEELSKTKDIEQTDVLDWFSEFFQHVGTSKFLTGRVNDKSGRSFAADLEWIIRPSNFAKIIEGKYHGTN